MQTTKGKVKDLCGMCNLCDLFMRCQASNHLVEWSGLMKTFTGSYYSFKYPDIRFSGCIKKNASSSTKVSYADNFLSIKSEIFK